MKCTKCGQSIPSPKFTKFPELKNWKKFMNEQLIKNLNKENNDASQENNQT